MYSCHSVLVIKKKKKNMFKPIYWIKFIFTLFPLIDAGDVYVWGYGILGKGPKLSESKEPECIPAILFGKSDKNSDVAVTKVFCGLHHFAAITSKIKIKCNLCNQNKR